MTVYGKLNGAVAGGVVGLLFGSFTLAVIFGVLGTIVGHAVDARHAEEIERVSLEPMPQSESELLGPERSLAVVAPPPAAPPSPRARALETCCQLLVSIATLEPGEVLGPQVAAMRVFFDEGLKVSPEERGQVQISLKVAISDRAALEAVDLRALELFAPDERLALVDAMLEVASARGTLLEWTERTIRSTARRLGVRDSELRELFDLRAGDLTPHFATLGLVPGATDEDLKRAYRKLAQEHHPDRAAHLGAAAVERASERFRAIDLAYETLRRARGL